MRIDGMVAIVTGGASGLGLATAAALVARGAQVVIADLPQSAGEAVARQLGARAVFAPADVTSEAEMERALDAAAALGPLRALVHCAGRGGALRILDKTGNPGALDVYKSIVCVNLIGSFNSLRLTAARMASQAAVEEERGICILTASIAAYEGQIGQVAYASSKAGIVGMTLVAARDLAARGIRVCTIAPGVFETPLLSRLTEEQRSTLGKAVPFPPRLGQADEFAALALHIIENRMLNGETIRLDGALRMPPR